MPDALPGKRQLVLGILATALLAVLGSLAVRTRADEECRASLAQATTAYKVEKVLRSASCREARDRP